MHSIKSTIHSLTQTRRVGNPPAQNRVEDDAVTVNHGDNGLFCAYRDKKTFEDTQLWDADTVKQAVAYAALLFRGDDSQKALACCFLTWLCSACVEALKSNGDERPISLLIGNALEIEAGPWFPEHDNAICHVLSKLASLTRNQEYSSLAERLQILVLKAVIQLSSTPPQELIGQIDSILDEKARKQLLMLRIAFAMIHTDHGLADWGRRVNDKTLAPIVLEAANQLVDSRGLPSSSTTSVTSMPKKREVEPVVVPKSLQTVQDARETKDKGSTEILKAKEPKLELKPKDRRNYCRNHVPFEIRLGKDKGHIPTEITMTATEREQAGVEKVPQSHGVVSAGRALVSKRFKECSAIIIKNIDRNEYLLMHIDERSTFESPIPAKELIESPRFNYRSFMNQPGDKEVLLIEGNKSYDRRDLVNQITQDGNGYRVTALEPLYVNSGERGAFEKDKLWDIVLRPGTGELTVSLTDNWNEHHPVLTFSNIFSNGHTINSARVCRNLNKEKPDAVRTTILQHGSTVLDLTDSCDPSDPKRAEKLKSVTLEEEGVKTLATILSDTSLNLEKVVIGNVSTLRPILDNLKKFKTLQTLDLGNMLVIRPDGLAALQKHHIEALSEFVRSPQRPSHFCEIVIDMEDQSEDNKGLLIQLRDEARQHGVTVNFVNSGV